MDGGGNREAGWRGIRMAAAAEVVPGQPIGRRMVVQMGFMDAIKSLFTSNGSARQNTKVYIVDVARIPDEKTGRRLSPRDQIQMLNALARVAKQEEFEIHALIESERPLREVDSGGAYNGVTVHFAADTEELVAQALKLAKSTGGALVSSGPTMESRGQEAGFAVISSSTFRKAFLPGNLLGGGERGGDRGGRSRRGGRDRRHERNGGRGSRAPREESAAPSPSAADADAGAGDGGAPADEHSAVRNLIDLVE